MTQADIWIFAEGFATSIILQTIYAIIKNLTKPKPFDWERELQRIKDDEYD